MTSSSSLYGTVTQQNTSSTNSTSLYGEAGTPIPDASGNLVVRGDLYVLSGNILTTANTGNLFPTNATTVNVGLAATAVNIGSATGDTTVNNNLVVDGNLTVDGTFVVPSAEFGNIQIAVVDNQTISTSAGELRLRSTSNAIKLPSVTSIYTDNTSSFGLLNQPTTVNAFLGATAVNIGAVTGTTNINNALLVESTGTFTGDITATGGTLGNISVGVVNNNTINNSVGALQLSSTIGDVGLIGVDTLYTDQSSFLLLNSPTTVTAFDSATSLTMGETTGTTTIRNDLVVQGDITADGGDFGNITIGVTDNNTINNTVNDLVLSAVTGEISLAGVNTVFTNQTTFNLLNSPTTVTAFDSATALTLGETTGTTFIRNDVSVGGDLKVNGNDIKSNGGTTAITLSGANVTVANDLTVNGNNINLAQDTLIGYSENNDRLNRPSIRSTTGNNSGFRVEAPNATTSAAANIGAFSTNDPDNGKFINISARGAATSDLRIQTGKYTAGVLGASGTVVSFIDNVTTYATVNPAGPTNPLDLATKAYVDAQVDSNTTYTVDASSTTGGANFNLVGSDATTDTIKFAGGTNVTVVATDANTITINAPDTNTTYTQNISATTGGANLNLVGSDATTDTVKFADGTGVTVSYTDASTATIAIGQAVGTSDDVQFGSVRTPTINANGGVSFVNTAPMGSTYATVNQFGPALGTDLTTVDYVNSVLPTVVTYDLAASSTTGGANLNLTGSNATTDTVKLTNGGHITATYTSATEVTLGSDATDANTATAIVSRDASGNFSASGATLGNITVGVADDQTITTTSGNLILDSVGGTLQLNDAAISSPVAQTWTVVDNNSSALSIGATGKAGLLKIDSTDNAERVVTSGNLAVNGQQIVVTQNTTYVPVTSALTTVSGQNGIAISSSTGGANGYGANIAIRYHTGDTTAAGNNAASVVTSAATGTSSAPTGVVSNLVLGAYNFDGYTAGTSPNYAAQIATANQGGGTTALSPLQAQGYARQNFTNSTTVTTAVTGASGTGSVATLTFATQNTGPYFVGQTVTIAGMTPSGYNGTYVLTAVSTSSVSYANATTGFTSGGTIAAQNTVTAAGTGFRIRGYANSTNMTVPNRFNFMDLNASTATFKSDAYTFADSVITGSTLTQKNYMTLGATVGSINQDTFTLKNSAATTTYATANSTSVTLNGDTVNLRNTAGTTTYVNATSTGTTITGAGLSTVTRTTAVETPGTAMSRPSMNIQLTRSDQAAPNDSDNTSFRTRVAGSNGTFYTISDIGSVYKTGGDNEFRVNLANGDQTTGSFSGLSVLSSKISETRIKAGTPSGTPGASTVSDVAILTPTNNTLRADALTLTDYAGTSLVGSKISYNRVYGQFEYNSTVTPAAINTAAVFPLGTAAVNNIATVGSTSRLIAGAAGTYNLQFSVQVDNADTGQDHIAYIWLRKNGVDVTGSTGRVTVAKSVGTIAGWNYLVSSANTTDYWEIAYAVEDLNLTFPFYAATAFAPSTASVITTLTPVGA